MSRFLSGKESAVVVTNTPCSLDQWSVTDSGDDIDTVNFESGGYDDGITGIRGAAYSMGGGWDANQNPYDDPPGIYPRDDLGVTKLYTDIDNNKSYNFPLSRVLQDTVATAVRGKVTFDANLKSKGTFTPPAG